MNCLIERIDYKSKRCSKGHLPKRRVRHLLCRRTPRPDQRRHDQSTLTTTDAPVLSQRACGVVPSLTILPLDSNSSRAWLSACSNVASGSDSSRFLSDPGLLRLGRNDHSPGRREPRTAFRRERRIWGTGLVSAAPDGESRPTVRAGGLRPTSPQGEPRRLTAFGPTAPVALEGST